MAKQDLEGRVAIITGASSGIGRAAAVDLAARGTRVVLNARRVGRLEEIADELNKSGKVAVCVAGDASEESVVCKMLDSAKETFGREANLVVVNAGRGLAGSVVTSDEKQWDEVVRVNLLGAARLMRAAALRMLPGVESGDWPGSARDIVVIGSTVGRNISPFSSVYGATKFAVNSLAEAMRRELGPKGIRVTLVEPGIVLSEFQTVAGYSDELVEKFKSNWGPLVQPADVADVISFIVSRPAHVHVNDVVIRPTRQDYP